MKIRPIAWIFVLGSTFFLNSALAYDCSGLPEWKRQAYYLPGDQVQYLEYAYENISDDGSKRDYPDEGFPWGVLGDGSCDTGGGDDPGDPEDPVDPQPLSIYGAWHCGDDYCTWSTERDMTDFDARNHWLIDRGDGSGRPSVNLVVLSFVHPVRLLEGTVIRYEGDDVVGCDPCGIPVGMNEDVVGYFTSNGIRVMLSIGGITYVDPWNQALADDPGQLGLAAAAVAAELGVGIEIDYEENRNPDLDGLQAFIDAYRSVHEYDPSGVNPAARLTIDLAAGDRWLIALTERATKDWLDTQNPVLDYANAMVTPRQPSADSAMENWQEHIDGKPQYDPPIPPLAPAKLTGSLWLTGRKPIAECVDFEKSLQHPSSTGDFVQMITPNGAGTSNGMLGYMFWAAECQGTRALCTIPADGNTCEGGMGEAAAYYDIPIPMKELRQE